MEVPVYSRDEIVNMPAEWIPVFLRGLRMLPGGDERRRILQKLESLGKIKTTFELFPHLPAELQVEVMRQASPTAREGSLVSHGMLEIADAALMENIRNNDLIDPSIGIADREKYFKVNPAGTGEYLSPEPGLWRQLKYYRDNFDSIYASIYEDTDPVSMQRVKDYQMYLVYGELTIVRPTKFVSLALLTSWYRLPEISDAPKSRVNLSMASYVRLYELTPEKKNSFTVHIDIPETVDIGSGVIYDFLNLPDVRNLEFNMVPSHFVQMIKPDFGSLVPERNWHINMGQKVKCRLVPLGPQALKTNTIFPSLQSDVWVL